MTQNNEENEIEEAYRRGYAQGFQTGITTQPENFDALEKRIKTWRFDLENKTGAPGTLFENKNLNNPNFFILAAALEQMDMK